MNQKNKGKNEKKQLVDTTNFCLVSNKIMVLGEKIDFMYREEPDSDMDSGWRFLSNTEDQEYLDDESNSDIFTLNIVANNDQTIIPYLDYPVGSELMRDEDSDSFITN